MEDLNTPQLSSTSGTTDDIFSASTSTAFNSNAGYGFEQSSNNYSENNAALPLISIDTKINLNGSLNEQNSIEGKEYSGASTSTISESPTTLQDDFGISQINQFDIHNVDQSGSTQNQLNSSYGWVEETGNTSLYKSASNNYWVYNETEYNFINYTDFNGWSIIGAEKVNEINQLAFGNSLSDQFYRYNMNGDWDPIDGDWLTGESLYQAESDFNQDFNSDGFTGSPLTATESAGSISVLKDFSGYAYAQDSSGHSVTINDETGAQMSDSTWAGWSLIGAESIDGNNTTSWKRSSDQHLFIAQHDSNWNWTTAGSYAATGSNSYFQAESDFNQDFNSDGFTGSPLTATESAGSISVLKDFSGYAYAQDSSGHSVTINDETGAQMSDSTWAGWSLIGAESIDGNNTTSWKRSSDQHLFIAQHDSNWNWTTAGSYAATGSNSYFQAESDFNQDFNSDGFTGSPLTATESAGSISVLKDFSGYAYAQDSSGHSVTINDETGAQMSDSTWAGWSLIGAESIDGNNTTSWKRSSDQHLFIAQHDSNWNWTTAGSYAATGSNSYFQAESDFNQDFNSDGFTGSPLTATESAGSISVLKDFSGYAYAQDSSGHSVTINDETGAQMSDSTWAGWSLIGAESIDGNNTTSWKRSSDQHLFIAQHDSNWNWTTAGSYAATGSNSYFQAESDFNQDFNSDGFTGSPLTATESAGSISVLKDFSGYAYAQDSSGHSVTINDETGAQMSDSTWAGWSLIGAESIDGNNTTSWKRSSDQHLFIAQHDSNWNWTTAGSYAATGSNSYFQAESDFNQDFNSDGFTGSPLTATESAGSISVLKDFSGYAYAQDSSGHSVTINDETGAQMSDSTWAGWSLIGAESIDGNNTTSWKRSSDQHLFIAQHDSNWNWTTAGSYAATGSNSYFQAESDFNQDFNGDLTIGAIEKISGITNSSITDNINISLSDDLFTHQELKSLLVDVASGGVTATELADLQTIETNLDGYLSATESSYQSYIFDAVVNGNSANQWWTGGTSSRISLGNLSEGSTEAHLNSLVDKWYGGLDRPTNFVQGDSAASASAMTFDYYEMVGDLFVDGVDFDDVRQGQAGTCYLLAAACSYADANSSIITDMFKDNGDGTYGVRFYDNSLSEVWVTVDSYVPSTNGYSTALAGNASWGLTGEKWVALLEKGYAQANETGAFSRGSDSSKNSYAAVEGGLMDALSHLSGNTSTTVSYYYTYGGSGIGLNGWSSAYGNQGSWNAFETQAINALNNNKALWLGSWGDTWGSNGRRDFVAGHAFAITAYDASTGLFTIVNPWGSSSGSSNHTFTARWSELATYGLDPIVSWA